MNAIAEQLEKLSNQMVRRDIFPFTGDWSATNAFLPVDAQLFMDDGTEIIYPNMGLINQNTINGQVAGFKKSSEQFKGLAKAEPTLKSKMEQNLRKLAVIASHFSKHITAYPSKYDDANLYYKNGFIVFADGTQVDCQIVVIIKNEDEHLNIALKIEQRKDIQSLPDAPELNDDATQLLMKMLG